MHPGRVYGTYMSYKLSSIGVKTILEQKDAFVYCLLD